VRRYITQKCGKREEGYEGKKVRGFTSHWVCFYQALTYSKFATAVSTRAALTLWYRSLRPNESVSEWRVDMDGTWYMCRSLSVHDSDCLPATACRPDHALYPNL
jgi:hypothetical protein